MLGFLLSSCYICVFYFYTPAKDKISVWAKIGSAGAFSCTIILYTMVTRNFSCLKCQIIQLIFVLVRRPECCWATIRNNFNWFVICADRFSYARPQGCYSHQVDWKSSISTDFHGILSLVVLARLWRYSQQHVCHPSKCNFRFVYFDFNSIH